MSDTSHYKCSCCGAPINYVPGTSSLTCEYCGTSVPVSSLIDTEKQDDGFQWDKLTPVVQTICSEREYVCKSCGATLQSFDNNFTTSCPYCGNNVSVKEETSGAQRPNLIIPFKIKRDEVKDKFKAFLKSKKLLPTSYTNVALSGELKAVYVPFWLFNCSVDGKITLHANKDEVTKPVVAEISTVKTINPKTGETTTTTQKTVLHYRLEREGHFEVNRLPVDASTHFDNDAMDCLEPFDYSALTDFSDVYFTGCLAEKYDSTPEDEMKRSYSKIRQGVLDYFNQTEKDYRGLSVIEDKMQIETADVKYAMLPIYTLNFNYNGKNEHLYMNGQTGKVVGKLPIDKGKAAVKFFIGFGIAFVISLIIFMFV